MPKVTVTIQAAAEHPDVLDIRDAMRQVLDYFDLLSGDDDENTLAWNITYSATNSPFTAEAEAVSLKKEVDITAIANTRIVETTAYISALSSGSRPTRALSSRRRSAAKRVFSRNTRGIGKTTVRSSVPSAPEISLTPATAIKALEVDQGIELANTQYLADNRERQEFGSVEGTIIDVGTDYNQPAIRIQERKSGRQIACRVGQEVIDSIAKATSLRDVWEHRRVQVKGIVSFDSTGQIIRVHARSVTPIIPRNMTIKDIQDTGFAGELSTEEYLEKLREGELG
jgi:hypothetical protein